MQIELLNPDITELKISGKNYILDYGYKKQYQDLSTKLKVESKESLIFNPTCGCTTSDRDDTEYGCDVTLKYDAKNRGTFSKVIKVVADRKVISEITLKGTII